MWVKRLFFIIIVGVVLFGCGGKVLNQHQMEELTYEFILAESSMEIRNIRDTEKQKDIYNEIYERYGTTSEVYERSLQYYAQEPKILEQIYENVQNRIDSLKAKVDGFAFHPGDKNSVLEIVLDTLNLIEFEESYEFAKTPDANSLRFDVERGTMLTPSDRYLFSLEMVAEAEDKLENTFVVMSVAYQNNKRKELRQLVVADGKRYRYSFFPQQNDTVRASKIYVNLFLSDEKVSNIRIDNVSLQRIYNSEKYPMISGGSQGIDFQKIGGFKKTPILEGVSESVQGDAPRSDTVLRPVNRGRLNLPKKKISK